MVRDTGFEPVTPSVSGRCSTTELTALYGLKCMCAKSSVLNCCFFLLHQLHELLVAADDVVFHIIRGDLGKEFLGAVDSGFFDLSEFER